MYIAWARFRNDLYFNSTYEEQYADMTSSFPTSRHMQQQMAKRTTERQKKINELLGVNGSKLYQ